jgi:hypothetical protein
LATQDDFQQSIIDNNIQQVSLLMHFSSVDPSDGYDFAIRTASSKGYVEIVKLLLKDKRVKPFDYASLSISNAFENGHTDIVELLWKNSQVKNRLKNNNVELFNVLTKKDDIKRKVNYF